MRWFEYSYQCQCGESERGYVPSVQRLNIRCYLCFRFQQPTLFRLHTDEIDYDEYLEEMFEEDDENDDDWDEEEEF